MPSLSLEQWGIVAAIISGFGGFIFGLAGLAFSIYQYREAKKDKQPHLAVTIQETTDYRGLRYGNSESIPVFDIRVINDGSHTVAIDKFKIVYKRQVIDITNRLLVSPIPCYLEPNGATDYQLTLQALQEELRSRGYSGTRDMMLAIFVDAQGREYRANRKVLVPLGYN